MQQNQHIFASNKTSIRCIIWSLENQSFFAKKDDFWVTIWYVRAIYRTNKWNIVSINWFLNAFWPTSLHYHQLVCFLTHFASIYFHASAVTMPSGRSVSILFTKWIFDNPVDPFSKFLLFTSGMRTTRPVHGAPIHTWSKFDLFWKTSTSPSLASSINQSNRKQAADWRKITNLIAIEGMVFYFICFWKRKRESPFTELSDLLLYPTCIRKIRFF